MREFVVYGDVEHAAREARDAVEGPEATSLHAAEELGRAPAQVSPVERARAFANRVRHAVGKIMTDLGHRLSGPHARPDGSRS